ncbi:hypothetical protein B0H10DRAFT_2059028 [Mycena sp. CBHHK59/15]|nr:hypothetical protein B0H10DRAFT_2059028 [Mycena sp. CBHHK59/15]
MASSEPKTPTNEDSTLNSTTVDKPGKTPSPAAEKTPHSFLSFLPTWVSVPLQSPKAGKMLFRCWIASCASFIILLPNASLRTVGTTSFFAILCSLFLPPYLPVQLSIFLLSTLVTGLLMGWGLGVGAMRAANAVRDQALIQAAGAQIQASIQANPAFQANPALAKTTAVFAGWFLDVRATAVYGVFLAVGAFIFGLMRAYAPKLIFMSIFGTIGPLLSPVDIFCTVGPLFPTKRYTLLNSTAISIGCYMAIALLTTLFVFPETMSHAIMDKVSAQLARVQTLIEIQDDVLAARPEELTPDALLIRKFKELRAAVIGAQQQLVATSGFVTLEFTWGRWSGDDVRSLEDPTIALITRVGADSDASLSSDTRRPGHDTYLLRQIHTRNAAREATHSVRPDDVLPLLDSATRALRAESIAALAAVRGMIDHVNTTRWRRSNSVEAAARTEALDTAAARLTGAITAFVQSGRLALLQPFLPLLENAEERAEDLPLRSLFIAYVFAANVLAIAQAALALVDQVRAIDAKRRRCRNDGAFGEDTSAPVREMGGKEERDYRRDPDSRPPTNVVQRLMHLIHNLYQWTNTVEAVFTFKYVFVSIALWLPAVFKSSAHFYYVEKGIWALIMAQTTINIYAADQIFNYVTRLVGTLIGLAFGLVAWYAGNGSGRGNPYGAAAGVAVCVLPLLFVRIFAPERFLAGNILCCATFALVAGYSWIDGHVVQFASPGIGWSVAWKRWTLVVTGSAASFIVMMFPPKSGRKAVRQRNAASIASLSNVYGFLISTWIANRDDEQPVLAGTPAAWTTDFRARLLALAEEMHAIRELTELAKWEGSIRGKWPAADYTKLVDIQGDMIASLAQLGGALGHLENEWRVTFLHSSKVLNPNFIADVMAVFSLISQSLRTGEPMHQVVPHRLLDRVFYHHGRAIPVVAAEENGKTVDVERIKSLNYMYYASGIVAVYQLLTSLDELHVIAKDLCGEVPMTGFAGWRDEFDRTHSVV